MIKKLYFISLHMKKQWMMYLFPLIFVYFILMQYQQQVLAIADENIMVKVYDISQKYGCIFCVWYQYLSWRYVLSTRQREIVKFESFKKKSWFILNFLLTYLLLVGYLVCISKAAESIDNVLMISIQYLYSSIEVALLINLVESPLSGLMLYLIYMFMCMAQYIPGDLCIINSGILPDDYGASWVLSQLLLCAILAGCIKTKSFITGIRI